MKSKFELKGFIISTDPNILQLKVIHNFLKESYWAKDIDFELLKKSIEHSLNFGVYYKNSQIGFARVITDYSRFAYIADVFILEEYRGMGLSKWLMNNILDHPKLKGIKNWMLKTWDAHALYKQFGFENPKYPERVMEFSRK